MAAPSWLDDLCGAPGANGAGSVRSLIRDVDWASTPLGPPETWPQSLRSVLHVMFGSRFAMCAAWGPALTFFYNDDYAQILGPRHPSAMGRTIREVWPDVWADIRPLIDRTLAGESLWLADLHLVMTRHGYEEDTWWTFSYSPLRDDDGRIVGFIDVCTDTTEKVVSARAAEAERERLRASETRFRALVDASSDAVYRMSADWRELRELEGRGFLTDTSAPTPRWMDHYLFREDQPELLEAVRRAIATKSIFEMEHRVRQADGGTGWILSRAIPVLDEAGDIVEWFGMAADVTERRRTDEHLRLVANELNHRVKNNLAMVQAIAAQTFRRADDPKQAVDRFSARLVALGRANDLLTGERWTGVMLRGVLEQAVQPHCDDPARLLLTGPEVAVTAKTALALTLAAHELATNATKYGAWSNASGRVSVTWTAEPEGDGQRVVIVWGEHGGPPVLPPDRRGFGSRLIERGLAMELDGVVTLAFEPEGLVCRIEAVVGEPEDL